MINWSENKERTVWKHKKNTHVKVTITPRPYITGYIVSHYHPGPGGTVVLQPPEYARTLAEARRKAAVHLRHWDDQKKWTRDEGFGRRMKK